MNPQPLTIGAERRKHPTYKHMVYWGTVYRGDSPIYQIGPYRRKSEAEMAAYAYIVEKKRKDSVVTAPQENSNTGPS